MKRRATGLLLLAGGFAAAGTLRASERVIKPIGPGVLREQAAAACADPKSVECQQAYAAEAWQAAGDLVRLAQRHHPRAAELAVRAADSGYPALRAAAAAALGELWSEAPRTPVLAELLDDPVPAVRTAARRALRSAADPFGQALSRRADSFSPADDDKGLSPEAPPAPASLGVPLPADALFLHFASDRAKGRSVFMTSEPAAVLVARLSKVGKGPYAPEQFRDAVTANAVKGVDDDEASGDSASGMPSAAKMEEAMAMAQKVMDAAAEHPDATPEEQSKYMAKALGHRFVDESLGDRYADDASFGDVKLFVVPLPDAGDATVAVYYDRALERTEVAVHIQP